MVRYQNIRRIFGANVKGIRVRTHASQDELADRCGIYRTYLSRIENGTANPSLLVIAALAESLNVDICDLVKSS